MPLPSGVHRVRVRGRTYYYWGRGKGAPRLPDPEAEPIAFAAAVSAHKGAGDRRDGTVAALVDAYLASPAYASRRPATQKDYRWHLLRVREIFGKFGAADIRPEHVREYRNSMEDRPVLANHALAVLRTLYAWAVEHNWPTDNPAASVKPLPHKSTGAAPWPAWAFDLVNEHMRADLRRAVRLGALTGQRLSDVIAMRLGDVTGDLLTVRQSKTGKVVRVPLYDRLAAEIEAAREDGRLHLVSRADGRPFPTAGAFQSAWQKEMAKPALRPIREAGHSFHGLRKTAVAELARAGCSVPEIASITGHSVGEVQRYLGDWSQEQLARAAVAKLERK